MAETSPLSGTFMMPAHGYRDGKGKPIYLWSRRHKAEIGGAWCGLADGYGERVVTDGVIGTMLEAVPHAAESGWCRASRPQQEHRQARLLGDEVWHRVGRFCAGLDTSAGWAEA
ncbi:hypothetical protein ABZV60_33145 [Streptomyces sp. NPDC004787]|uniref:hypothetical protein n=1 Tax=Streptomyces sp. NPDC004787 TaxID=3154291 RepID=UPI0033A522FB